MTASPKPPSEDVVKGIPVSFGIGIGPITSFDHDHPTPTPVYSISPKDHEREIARLDAAIDAARAEVAEIRADTEERLGEQEARILLVSLQILEDPTLQRQIQDEIKSESTNAEAAVTRVIERYGEAFAALKDPMARDRASDLRDAGRRIVDRLAKRSRPEEAVSDVRTVLVTRELFPSDAARLDPDHLAAIITEVGGKASHAAILARALRIPAVTGVRNVDAIARRSGAIAVVDGREGTIVVGPAPETVAKYEAKADKLEQMRAALCAGPHLPAVTQDGTEVDMMVNVENAGDVMPDDLGDLKGIGLYRTEFIYMDRDSFPSEDEQFEVYKSVCQRAGDREVVFRTIDIGGDKRLPYFRVADEDNPALGWRGYRISDEWPDLFIAQVRALLRASAFGKVRIMLPMVTTVEEVRRATALVRDVKADLRRREIAMADRVPIGVMVEVPAAVLAVDAMLKEVDFASIGSNDLIQYILAVDRNNARVARLSEPFNPSVLRAIQTVIKAGQRVDKPISLCGEMAGSFYATLVLLGMGLRRFSMARHYVPGVGRLIRGVRLEDAQATARRALSFVTTDEVKAFLQARTREIFREMNIPLLEADE